MAKKKHPKILINQTQRFGRGSERLYVYTFQSLLKPNKRFYPVKIGMTSRSDASKRIMEQLNSSNAEPAMLLLEISCDNAAKLEKRLHKKLNIRRVMEAPGKEWFLSNVDELKGELVKINPAYGEHFNSVMKVWLAGIGRLVYTLISGLWQLLCWLLSASTRSYRKKARKNYRRAKRKSGEITAKFFLVSAFLLCLIFLIN